MRRTFHSVFGHAFLGLAFLGVAVPARADVLLLEDGRILERPKMERAEDGVKVHFENGVVLIPSAMIEEAILENEPAFVPKTAEERAKTEKGLVPFEGKWVKPHKRDALIRKRIAARKAEVEEIRQHMKWKDRWREKTKHFEFEYTVAPHVCEYYRDLMEAYFKEFAKTWKVRQPKDLGRLTVCFYVNMGDFRQIGGAGGSALAYFRFVKPLELNFYYDRLDPDGTEQVMYHEVNHYLQLLMNPDFNMPHFPGEALAEYYGASKFDPKTKKLVTGHVLEGRLTEVKMDILAGKMLGLEKMLTTDRMYEHYYWGWSLAHFLMNDKRYRKKFERFVKDLAYGKNVRRVASIGRMTTVSMPELWAHFKRTMGLKNDEAVAALEAEWHAYVKDELQVVSSRGLEKAATRAMNLGYRIKSKRLFKEAIDKGTMSALAYHRYAELLGRDGSRKEAMGYMRKAIELAPLEGVFYRDLGRALQREGEEEEGKRLLALALELDPDNPWLAFEIEQLMEEDDS